MRSVRASECVADQLSVCSSCTESNGVNHGVELYQDVIDYAHERLEEFLASSAAVDQFDFCPPQFVCGESDMTVADFSSYSQP